MKNDIEILETKFKEFLSMPNKTKEIVEEQEKISIELENKLNNEMAGLINELSLIGINIISIWDLVNTKKKYPQAIPILIEHLLKPYHEKNIEGIVRALAVKESKNKAVPVLIQLYNNLSKERMLLRWTIGNTICSIVTEADVEKIIPIVQDSTNGMSRQMFVLALGKFKNEKIVNILNRLLNEPEIAMHIKTALK